MRHMRKIALVTVLTLGLVGSPVVARAGHWGPSSGAPPPPGFFSPPPRTGLGTPGAALGTAAIVGALANPPVAYVPPAYAPPPPPAPSDYEDGYRRGYDQGRRDAD